MSLPINLLKKWLLQMALCLLAIVVFTPTFVSSQEHLGHGHLKKGMELYKSGDYKEALGKFFEALKVFPSDSDIYLYIGLTYQKLDETENAIYSLQSALELDDENLEAHSQLGAILNLKGKYKDAVGHLERVWESEPEREDLGLLLGMAYYNLAQYEKALNYLKAGKATDRTSRSLTLYYTALAEQQLGLTEEALVKLEEIVTYDPTSPAAPLAIKFIEVLKVERRVKKRFGLEFFGRAGYDDNVMSVPTTNEFSLRERGQDSYFESASLTARFLPFKGPKWETSLTYDFNETLYNSIRGRDAQSHKVTMEGLYKGLLGPTSWEIRPSYSFDYFLVNYHWFLSRHSFRLPYLINESPINTSVVEYDAHLKDFKTRVEASLAEDDRDALTHELGFTHFIHTADWKHYFKAGYTREREGAEGDNWDYWGNRALLGFQYTFPLDVSLRADVSWEKFNYKNTDTAALKRREDTERFFYTSLSKELTDRTTVFFDYTRRRNTSNIALFDFEQNLFSFGVQLRY